MKLIFVNRVIEVDYGKHGIIGMYGVVEVVSNKKINVIGLEQVNIEIISDKVDINMVLSLKDN